MLRTMVAAVSWSEGVGLSTSWVLQRSVAEVCPMVDARAAEEPKRLAVFYDLDGTLVRGSVIPYYLHYVRTLPSVTDILVRHARLALEAPQFALSNLVSRAD